MLSKEEVEAEKATMRAIDARPIKKVAEAKQRKRKRLQVRPAAEKASGLLRTCSLITGLCSFFGHSLRFHQCKHLGS